MKTFFSLRRIVIIDQPPIVMSVYDQKKVSFYSPVDDLLNGVKPCAGYDKWGFFCSVLVPSNRYPNSIKTCGNIVIKKILRNIFIVPFSNLWRLKGISYIYSSRHFTYDLLGDFKVYSA